MSIFRRGWSFDTYPSLTGVQAWADSADYLTQTFQVLRHVSKRRVLLLLQKLLDTLVEDALMKHLELAKLACNHKQHILKTK